MDTCYFLVRYLFFKLLKQQNSIIIHQRLKMFRILIILTCAITGASNFIQAQNIAAERNTDGGIELFYINSSNELCCRYQVESGGNWSGEEVFTISVEKVFLDKGPDGSLELFYIDSNNDLYHSKKFPSDDDWPAAILFRENVISVTLLSNNEDYLRLFYVLEDHAVKYREQISFGGLWSDEEDFISYAEVLAAAYNADGRLEVFYTIASDVFMHKWQLTPDGDWTDAAVFSDPAKAITVATNADGRLEVFFIDVYDHLHTKWQTAPSSGWADDAVFANEAHLVRVGYNNDGRIEVVFISHNNILFHNWQTAPSSEWGTAEQFGWYASDVSITNNQDQRLEVFYLGTDGLLYHRYQLEPGRFWSSEYPLLPEADPPFSFEEYSTQPSFSNDPDWHINDHCFIRSDQGTWHMYGIMYPDPGSGDMSYVNYFGHASAESLLQVPWTEEAPPFYESLTTGEVLWAPHIVFHEGIYYMFYCGGGEVNSYKICLRTSEDLVSWSDKQILFQDGYQARDPMILYVEEIQKWVMYYCATETSTGGNYVVLCKTSEDLYSWSGRQVVYRDLHTGTDYGPTESPFVVKRGGFYYLFIGPRPYDHPTATVENWEHPGYVGTDVFRSASWNQWTNADFVGWVDAHAPEIILDNDGLSYISHCGVLQGGLYIRRMNWLDGINSDNVYTDKPGSFYLLKEIVPNPFIDYAVIHYSLDGEYMITIDIIDLMGKQVKSLINKIQMPGGYSLNWDGTNSHGIRVPQGVYLCCLSTGDRSEMMKLILLDQ